MEVAEGYAFLLNLVTAGVASGIYTGIMGKQLATGNKASLVSRGFALFGLVLTVVGGGLAVRAALANAGGKIVATTVVQAAEAEASLAYATDPNKLRHIFASKHNLEPLVEKFGSQEAVIKEILGGLQGHTPASGIFQLSMTIGGQNIIVRGAVVNGIIKLGTAFTP